MGLSNGPSGGVGDGLVVGAHGRDVVVETAERRRLLCHRRGKKTECVVGDRVHWQPAGDGGVIEAVLPRTSLLWREDRWRSKSFAANLDRLLVLVAGDPPLAESLLARALVAAAHAGIDAQVVLNKIDLPQADAARARLEPYRRADVPVHEVSVARDGAAARNALMPLLHGRTTLLLGASGVGKSTLINLLVPDAAAQVGEISRALNAGRHTTTTTSWYWLDAEHRSAVLDSPGVQSFGLQQIEAAQLASLMPDLARHVPHCRFANCTHRSEPACAVQAAAASGEVEASRLQIYRELFEELSQPRW
ncbi:MAG: ribosome small subunit-dependent GTPase A [Ideonella sp.]|nr:ribosome small subunit-dependent GTPase A [Ideonella sp.]MCC7456589.1 ribosome small subunit-dependent GTPase A [Nitrospira sp.]